MIIVKGEEKVIQKVSLFRGSKITLGDVLVKRREI
jgi:hypothetical protein